jgi:hypothetical protein
VKVRVTDLDALSSVPALDLVAYFRASGWNEIEHSGPLSIWEFKLPDGRAVDAELPQRAAWRDYARHVQLALEQLCLVEGRSALAILRDIAEVSADVVRLKAQGTASDGTIPLNDGAAMVASLGKMLLSAACSAVEPRKAFHTRKPAQAVTFADNVRLGQTERGSYVVSAISRVRPVLQTSQLLLPGWDFVADSGGEPFERRAVRVLGEALVELENAASRGIASSRLDAFEESVPRGVSADLCESIALLKSCGGAAFHVRIGWAPIRPAQNHEPVAVVFTRDALEVIDEAGRMLRDKEPTPSFVVEGLVHRVAREPTDEDPTGEVEVLAVVNGAQRPVRLQLTGEDWKRAHQALGERRIVRCEGELVRTTRPFRLNRPGALSFVTLEDP